MGQSKAQRSVRPNEEAGRGTGESDNGVVVVEENELGLIGAGHASGVMSG